MANGSTLFMCKLRCLIGNDKGQGIQQSRQYISLSHLGAMRARNVEFNSVYPIISSWNYLYSYIYTITATVYFRGITTTKVSSLTYCPRGSMMVSNAFFTFSEERVAWYVFILHPFSNKRVLT